MKIKRIATIETLKRYEPVLRELIPQYLRKSLSKESVIDILKMIRNGCNNPFFHCCVVENDKGPAGFVIATVRITDRGKQVLIDHFHAPNLKSAGKIYEVVTGRLCRDHDVPQSEVFMTTYRNPDAWVRFTKTIHQPMELYGWVLKRKEE